MSTLHQRSKISNELNSTSKASRSTTEPIDNSLQHKLVENFRQEHIQHAIYVQKGVSFLCFLAFLVSWLPFFWSLESQDGKKSHESSSRSSELLSLSQILVLFVIRLSEDFVILSTYFHSILLHFLASFIVKGKISFNFCEDVLITTESIEKEKKLQWIGLLLVVLPPFFLNLIPYYKQMRVFHDTPNPWLPLLTNILTITISIVLRRDIFANKEALQRLEKAKYNFKTV